MVCFLFDELGGSLLRTETENLPSMQFCGLCIGTKKSQKHTWSLYLNCKEKKENIFVI